MYVRLAHDVKSSLIELGSPRFLFRFERTVSRCHQSMISIRVNLIPGASHLRIALKTSIGLRLLNRSTSSVHPAPRELH